MSLSEQLKALQGNKETVESADPPNPLLLDLFSSTNLKKRKMNSPNPMPTKKQKIMKEIPPPDDSSSSDDEDSSEETSSSEEDLPISTSTQPNKSEDQSKLQSSKKQQQVEKKQKIEKEKEQSVVDKEIKEEEKLAEKKEKDQRTIFVGNLPTKTKKKVSRMMIRHNNHTINNLTKQFTES